MKKSFFDSLIIKLFGAILVIGGLKAAITGRAGQRTDFASGDHVRILGVLCIVLGAVLFYTLIRRKP